MTKIVLVSGSLRRNSLNSAALDTVRTILHRRDSQVTTPTLSLRTLPYYDQDLDEAGGRKTVRAARELVSSADALVISTPSYNGAMPGVLKNALDWLSRPWGLSALTGKPVAVLSASIGERGASEAQLGLRDVLGYSGAVVVDHLCVALGSAEDLRVATDGFAEPSVVSAVASVVDALTAQLSPVAADMLPPNGY